MKKKEEDNKNFEQIIEELKNIIGKDVDITGFEVHAKKSSSKDKDEDIDDDDEFPRHGEKYWSVDGGFPCDCRNINPIHTKMTEKAGLLFKTEKEAMEFLAWLMARKVLVDDTKGFQPDGESVAYAIGYCFEDEKLEIGMDDTSHKSTPIMFGTPEDAKESMEKHEKEWKIYLGVVD